MEGVSDTLALAQKPPWRVAMVGATGFEPATSSSRTKRATKLRYAPTIGREECVNSGGGQAERGDEGHFGPFVLGPLHGGPGTCV